MLIPAPPSSPATPIAPPPPSIHLDHRPTPSSAVDGPYVTPLEQES